MKLDHQTSRDYAAGYIVEAGDEICGVIKGFKQILAERCVQCQDPRSECEKAKYRREAKAAREKLVKDLQENQTNDDLRLQLFSMSDGEKINEEARNIACQCLSCTLAVQPDFLGQKTALEELYERFSAQHHVEYRCLFLPKFHPEVNPIERCWSRQKWHVRRFSDGTVATLKRLMQEGISEAILPLSMIRMYIRLSFAYLLAYMKGLDIVGADSWIKQHRSHTVRLWTKKCRLCIFHLTRQPRWWDHPHPCLLQTLQ